MNWPSQDQVYAALRYVGVAAGTIGSLAATFGVMTPEQSAAFAADVQALVSDLTRTFGDISKLVLLLLPIITVFLARLGIQAASPTSQRAAVSMQLHTIIVQADDHDAAVKAASVVAALPDVKQIVAAPAIANATESPKVVAAIDAKEVPK